MQHTLYHWTHKDNIPSIARHGLDPAKATGRRALVWLCAGQDTAKRALEVCKRHGWVLDDLILLTVDVEDLAVWPFHKVGFFTSESPISPRRIRFFGDPDARSLATLRLLGETS